MDRKRAIVAAAIAAVSAVGAYALTTVQFFDPIFGYAEDRTLGWRQRSVMESPDEASAEAAPYMSPFPRNVLADLIEVASAFGASAIGLDVFFQRRYPELEELFGGDERLRAAIERAGNVILAAPLVHTDSGFVARRPDPYFADVAAGVGYAEIPTAFDEVTEATLFTRTENLGLVPGFALALYAQSRDLDVDSLMASIETKGFLDLPGLPRRYGALKEDVAVHNMRILYAGPPSRPARIEVAASGQTTGTGAEGGAGAFTAFAADAVSALSEIVAISPDLVSDFYGFADRVVMVGSGFHAEEQFRTPFYDMPDEAGKTFGWMFGTEVHAHALHDLLEGRFVEPLGRPWVVLLLLAVAALITGMTFGQGVTIGATTAVVLVIAEMGAAWVTFDASQVHIPIVGPALAATLAFLGSTSYISIIEGREKRVIRGAFSKYLSPVLVDELVKDPSRLKLGGEKRPMSVLFSDLAGFTSLSEAVEPEVLVALLNEYLDDMADIVMAEGGTLDKYIGDAIMALYGAPVPLEDHALHACRTALLMQRRLEEMNEGWAEEDRPSLGVRIGINTGHPVVGNIGGEKRFDYTALGDAVNLAARLEPACKTYKIGIMISGETRDQAGDRVVVRELDLLAVYGKEEPVPVFELVALAGEEIGDRAELIEHFDAGVKAYRDRDFEAAIQHFRAAEKVDPEDGPTLLYLERCEEYKANPPPPEWDAVERRQVK